jgi:hypothetical protein
MEYLIIFLFAVIPAIILPVLPLQKGNKHL